MTLLRLVGALVSTALTVAMAIALALDANVYRVWALFVCGTACAYWWAVAVTDGT